MTTSIYHTSTIQKRANEFKEKSKIVHGDFYDYSKILYSNAHNKIEIICPEHGSFYKAPKHHLDGQGCQECSNRKRLDTELFIERAIGVHKDRYDYSMVEYIGIVNKVDIICEKHGTFSQTSHDHLKGSGCIKCANENKTVGKLYLRHKNIHEICYLYNIKLTGNGEEFYKWGISKNLDDRHRKIHSQSGYNIEIINVIIDTRLNCDRLEDKLLHKYKRYQYKPEIKFGGWTECYKK